MNWHKLVPICLLILAPAHAGVSPASAADVVKNAFTYQGELTDAGSPASGDYDFEFKMFDAVVGGTQIGGTMTADDVAVAAGRFTTVLEPNVLMDGTRTFLEIGVRPGASGGAYTTLTPRQELTAVPYALGLMPGAFIKPPPPGLFAGPLLGLEAPPASPAIGIHIVTEGGNGVFAQSANTIALRGIHGGTGIAPGVQGESHSPAGDASAVAGGMLGANTDATSAGVLGINQGAGMGVYGEHESSTGTAPGVKGVTQSSANSATGVLGEVAPTSAGSFSAGVKGVNNGSGLSGIGVWGAHSFGGWGVYGESSSGRGVYGLSVTGTGVFARSSTGIIIDGWSQSGRRFQVDNAGNVTADGTYTSPAADFAELLPASGDVEPGDVLIVDSDGNLTRSSKQYDSAVVGVHSTRPGFLGGANGENMESKIPLAVMGVVPVKVTDENGPITPGDLLVASSVTGHAMRADEDPPNGTVIGKALQPATGKRAVINAILMLQ